MKRLVFQTLEIENFNSIENMTLDLINGKHLLTGPNGSGKSSIFESLVWTLYKKSIRERDPSRNYLGNCRTAVKFSIDSDEYYIVRYHKDKSKGSTVELFVNNENVSPRKLHSIEDEIQEIIGISSDLFVSTIVVLQGLPLNFTSLGASTRKQVIEDLLGFSIWATYGTLFSDKYKEVALQRSSIDTDYQSEKEKMISMSSSLEMLKRFKQENTEVITSDIVRIKAEIREIRKDSISLTTLNTAYDKTALIQEQLSISSTLSTNKYKLNDLSFILSNNSCSQCNQSYPESKISECISLSESLIKKNNKLEQIRLSNEKIINDIIDRERLITNNSNKIDSLSSQLIELSQKLYTNSESSLDSLQSNLDSQVETVNCINNTLTTIGNSLSNIEYFNTLLVPSSKFRARVLDRYLGYINSIIDSIIPLLFSDIRIKLIIDTKGSGIDIEIFKSGRSTSYKSMSGGEKRRLDIILILSFQRFLTESSGISSNLMVYDEIFDSLDSFSVQAVVSSIDALFPDSSCVYVVTHNQSIKTLFSSALQIEKVDEITNLIGYKFNHE